MRDHRTGGSQRRERSARIALLVFVAAQLTSLVLCLVHGRQQWFFLDEWDFLANRDATDIRGLLRPHNEHWSSLPILVYRLLWHFVGLRTYLPYQLVLIGLHLTAALLLRMVMRRAGVGPWIATAASSAFVLFGSGSQNILWAFQVGFVASLVFGLAHLLLADHEGSVDRRDWFGLLAAFAGLMCSGIAVVMVVIVGLAVWVRRGPRVAMLHTVPVGVLFAAWWLAFARDEYDNQLATPQAIGRFVVTGASAAFEAIGQLPGAGLALAVLLVVGVAVAVHDLDRSELRRRAAPGAMLVGALMFLVLGGLGRGGSVGGEYARASRYLHIVAALSLPALAVAAQAVAGRWRALTPVVLGVLLIGVPGNVDAFVDYERGAAFARGKRSVLLALPRVPIAAQVPGRIRPDPMTPELTIGWLRDGVASGRIPDPGPISPAMAADLTLRLSIDQTFGPTPGGCRGLDETVERRLEMGEFFGFDRGWLQVAAMADGSHRATRTFDPAYGTNLTVVAGPIAVSVAPAPPYPRVAVCGLPAESRSMLGLLVVGILLIATAVRSPRDWSAGGRNA